MSSRTAERVKAVRQAWERERQLVSSGEGTRDWSPEQQRSILDVGVAFDDEGKPFEGQHMKSVVAYPEYAGDPNNIQFLTRQEHLEAHDGSWQNQTNWYYDPVTKQKFPFADGLIPCRVIQLSDPIIITSHKDVTEENESESMRKIANAAENDTDTRITTNKTPVSEKSHSNTTMAHNTYNPELITQKKFSIGKSKIFAAIKSVGRFIVEHPAESFEIAGVVATGIVKVLASISKSSSTSDTTNTTRSETTETDQCPSTKNEIAAEVADIIEKAKRASPRAHEVPGHGQRYHTKDGVIWKEKGPYPRGGSKK